VTETSLLPYKYLMMEFLKGRYITLIHRAILRKNYLKGVLLFIIVTIGVCLATTMFTKDNIEKLSKGLETQYSNGRAYEPGEAGYAVVKIINIEETNIQDDKLSDGEKFYLVEHDKGTTMLKATPDEVKKMLGDSVTKDAKLYNMEKPIYAKIEGYGPKRGRKNRTTTVPVELREKFDRYITGPTKLGSCFVE